MVMKLNLDQCCVSPEDMCIMWVVLQCSEENPEWLQLLHFPFPADWSEDGGGNHGGTCGWSNTPMMAKQQDGRKPEPWWDETIRPHLQFYAQNVRYEKNYFIYFGCEYTNSGDLHHFRQYLMQAFLSTLISLHSLNGGFLIYRLVNSRQEEDLVNASILGSGTPCICNKCLLAG